MARRIRVRYRITDDDLRSARSVVLDLLKEKGIEDYFIVKLKPGDAPTARVGGPWVALYRSRSQFLGKYPIIWINSDLPAILQRMAEKEGWLDDIRPWNLGQEVYDALVQNMLHEYGHIIYEYADRRIPKLARFIDKTWGGPEEFAEDFMRFVRGDFFQELDDASFKKVIRLYLKGLKQ